MLAVVGVRASRFSLPLVFVLGGSALAACSYEFGGSSGIGGAGNGTTASMVYVTASGTTAAMTSAAGTPASATSATTDASTAVSTTAAASSSTGIPAVCGDGVIEGGETCDGETAGFGAYCFDCSLCKGGKYEAEVGRCYFYAPTNDGQSQANSACSDQWIQGASLAQPIDDVQRTAMNHSVPVGGDLVYFGLKRQGSAYAWTDGTPAADPPWAALQPVETFDCVTVQEFGGGYYWVTAECPNFTDLVRGYVCEWKPPPS